MESLLAIQLGVKVRVCMVAESIAIIEEGESDVMYANEVVLSESLSVRPKLPLVIP